jgi:hypothetical protein
LVAGIEKQTFMRTKSVLLCVSLFIGIAILSCGKDEIKTPSVPNGKDTTVIVPPKEDIIYVIDTTKKTTINEIKFWEDYNMATVSGIWNSVIYSYGRFIAVGSNGQFAYSADGTSWTTQTVGGSYWYDVAFGNNLVVAVGGNNGQIAYSTNGSSTWNISAVGSNLTSTALRGVAYHDVQSMWFAVGNAGRIFFTGASLSLSTWNVQTVGSGQWYDVAFGNNLVVAVGSSGQIAYSINGITWTTQTVGSNTWYSVAYGNGLWVAVGKGSGVSDGQIAYSTNGASWTAQTLYGPEELRDVAYDNHNNRWIAVGENGMAFSTNGTSWTYKGGSVGWNGITIKQIQ